MQEAAHRPRIIQACKRLSEPECFCFSNALLELYLQVPLYGQATGLSRDLQKKLNDLQARPHPLSPQACPEASSNSHVHIRRT